MIDLVKNIYMTGREDLGTLTSYLSSGRNTDDSIGSVKASAAAVRIFASLGMVYAGFHAGKVVCNIAANVISIALSAATAASVGLLSYNAFTISKADERKNLKDVAFESVLQTKAFIIGSFKNIIGKFIPPADESVFPRSMATKPDCTDCSTRY